MSKMPGEIRLQGNPICRGISIGRPVLYEPVDEAVPEFSLTEEQLDAEIARFRQAFKQSRIELGVLQKALKKDKYYESASIIEAQLQLMQDPMLTTHIESAILNTKKNAESVFLALINQYKEKFNSINDPFFCDRFRDIQDISRRVMNHLRATHRVSLANAAPDSIIFARELTAADTVEAGRASVSALVTEHGGATSHSAIVAKAKGTPYVSNVPIDKINPALHNLVIVDGRTGEIILNPHAETLKEYQRIRGRLEHHLDKLHSIRILPSETFEGRHIRLSANIERAGELVALHQYGGSGVGLFRSEYICFAKNDFPSEEEQFKIYKELVNKMQGLPIVIRTFDMGGDKRFPNQKNNELNPFLGCRAIRFLLQEKGVFKTQLRAILRASAYGDVSILFPMISTLTELVEAKKVVAEAKAELVKERKKHKDVKIGSMIEVPSAALIADLLAKECDFLSIGTNDLVQYTLAVDRSNHAMSFLYKPTHPSVLRLIKMTLQEAARQNTPVTICGEIAADPRFTALLLGLGVHELSVATRYIPTIRSAIRNTSITNANKLVKKAFALSTAEEIQTLLTEEYKKSNPEDHFYNY